MSGITVAQVRGHVRGCDSKNFKLAPRMPSAELVKTWGSDKNDRTAHANIVLRRTHTNADEDPLTICAYTATLDMCADTPVLNVITNPLVRTAATDASSISTAVYRERR